MNNRINAELLKRLPAKYHDRVKRLDQEDCLVDGCKYIVYFTEDYTDGESCGGCYPARNITEAINFIKHCLYKIDE